MHLKDRDLLVLPQKSSMSYAMDPDQNGKVVWEYRLGKGSGLGGMWGAAIEGGRAYIGTADLLTETPGGVHALNVAMAAWRGPRRGRRACARDSWDAAPVRALH